MENNIQNIDEYMTEANNLYMKKRNSPLTGCFLAIGGIAITALSCEKGLTDTPKMLLLTLGAIAALVGIALVICSFLHWHHIYQPTGKAMKVKKCYVAQDDRDLCRKALASKDATMLVKAEKVASSSTLLYIVLEQQGVHAVVQMQEYVPHRFEAATAPIAFDGSAVAEIERWIKK